MRMISDSLRQLFSLHERDGYWGPVEPNFNYCESNYIMTTFIAEPLNMLSSVGLVLAGANAMHQSRMYNFERRFMLLGFSVVLMGATSMCSHATLTKSTQLWDEVAMACAAMGWICVLFQINQTTHQTSCLSFFACLSLGLWALQTDLDFETVAMGIRIHLIACTISGLFLLNTCVTKHCNLPLLVTCSTKDPITYFPHPSMVKLQLMARWQVVCLLLALVAWTIEHFFCNRFRSFQFHSIWHLLLGLSCHYGLQFAMALRQSILHKAPPATSWSLGGLLGQVVPTEVPSRAMGAQLRWLLKMAGVDKLDSTSWSRPATIHASAV